MTQRTFADPRRGPEAPEASDVPRWVERAPPDPIPRVLVLGGAGAVVAALAVSFGSLEAVARWPLGGVGWPLEVSLVVGSAALVSCVALMGRLRSVAASRVRPLRDGVELEFRPFGRSPRTVRVDFRDLSSPVRALGGTGVSLTYRATPKGPGGSALLTLGQARALLTHPAAAGWRVDTALRAELARSAAPGTGDGAGA